MDFLLAMGNRVTENMGMELTGVYSADELNTALKQMHPMKAPRPDEMSPLFYQCFWHIVGLSVTKVVLHYLN